MQSLLEKISSYNLFNYLLPGVLFVVILNSFTEYSLVQDNLVSAAFLYYFIGLVISRFGSLAIEPVLKKISFLEFAKYRNYASALKHDSDIRILSEVNNMYRTICSMLILLGLAKIYECYRYVIPLPIELDIYLLYLTLICMFLWSYRKQTMYIKHRVNSEED